VGKAALEGRRGILSVEKGWRNGREANRVVYDPSSTTVRDMEDRLKAAGTYRETLREAHPR
jgi:hypothetical protein